MKLKYIYSLFIIGLLLPAIALIVIEMNNVSFLTYIKMVAILTFLLLFVSMAIIMMFYMNYIDKDKNDFFSTIEESDTPPSVDTNEPIAIEESGDDSTSQLVVENEKINQSLSNENKLLDEVKDLLKEFKTELGNERTTRHQTENENTELTLTFNNVLEDLKTLLDEYKGYGKEEIERLQNDVDNKDTENKKLVTANKELTTKKSSLEQDKEKLITEKSSLEQEKETLTTEKSLLEQEKETLTTEKSSLEQEKEKLTTKISLLEQDKEKLTTNIQDTEKKNKELTENNTTLTEFARYGLDLVKIFNDEDVDTPAYLSKLRGIFSQYDALQRHDKMCEEIEGICDEASKTTPVYSNLLTLRDNMIKQFKEELQLQDLPLSDEVKRYNLGKLINIAMVAFDLMETMEYSINHSEAQKLSVEIALGLKSIETEINKCEQVDFDPNKTPRWLRALKSTLESTNADLSSSIISGRRL